MTAGARRAELLQYLRGPLQPRSVVPQPPVSPQLVKDLLDLPETVRKGDFVEKIDDAVAHAERTAKTFVVTPALAEAFDRAVGINPFHPLPHQALAALYADAGQPERAEQARASLEMLK